jgi:hypothetical protein
MQDLPGRPSPNRPACRQAGKQQLGASLVAVVVEVVVVVVVVAVAVVVEEEIAVVLIEVVALGEFR